MRNCPIGRTRHKTTSFPKWLNISVNRIRKSHHGKCNGEQITNRSKAYYEGVFKEQVEEVGFILWPANPLCGCSPDGIVTSKNRGIEIKCPFTLNAHIESFLIKDNTTFKSYKPQYYWQVMSSLLFTGFDSWDFVSYHPFFKPDKRLTSIEILPCIADFEMLKERLQAATIVRENLIREIEL